MINILKKTNKRLERSLKLDTKKKNNIDLKIIKGIAKISVSKTCRKHKIDVSNLYHGKTSNANLRIIRKDLEKQIDNIYN